MIITPLQKDWTVVLALLSFPPLSSWASPSEYATPIPAQEVAIMFIQSKHNMGGLNIIQ